MNGPVAIIGLGCIGGSLGRALAAQGVPVSGWSRSPADRAQAAAVGLRVPEGDDAIAAVCHDATAVVIAVPLEQIGPVAAAAQRSLPRGAVFLHAGGLQRRTALGLDDVLNARLLGAHPLAGSHESGFGAARADLFVGCTVSIESRASAAMRERAEWVWRTAGAVRVEYRPAEEHDRLMTWISHLPQLVATALAASLAARDVSLADTGSGARDTTRLAASPLAQWEPLLAQAPAELAGALEEVERTLTAVRRAVAKGDRAALATIWERGRAWRRGTGGERRA